jgi:molecular chaperone GrpE
MTKQQKTKVDELREALKKKHEAEGKAATHAPVPPPQTSAGEGREGGADELTEQIRAAEEEAKNHYDKLLRVMAEFDNFKKRMGREREEQFKYANEKLLVELLPVIDDLDRVLDHISPDAPDDVKLIADGVGLVQKSLISTLSRFGLKEIPALGEEFDPSKHEAIAVVESEAHEPGHVMAVHRKGYWLGERLLRAAMVTVAKAKEAGMRDAGRGTRNQDQGEQ